MRNSYGYDSYRGRSGARTVLTVLAVVLLVLLLLLVGFFFLAQRYVVYYDDGSVHFEFPWSTQAQATPTPLPTPDQPVVVVTPEPTPEPTPAPFLPLLVELPISSLTGGTAAQEVASAGGNAALFTMKAENGHLAYTSAEGWANYAKVTQTDPDLNGAISDALAAQDLYTVARVSCFKDDDTPYYYGRSNGLRTGNGNWRDETGSRWFSPAAQGARDYIIGICREVAALGFDEIWLDYCFFPAAGRLTTITRNAAYNDDTLTEDLEEFYRQLREALTADYPDLKISMTVAPDLMSGQLDPSSGQTWELLGSYADRVYMGPGEIAPEDPFFPGGDASSWFSHEDVVTFGRKNPLFEISGQVLPTVADPNPTAEPAP